MDEYMMSWSDAIRAESSYASVEAVPTPAEDVRQFGTLGRALWRERASVRMMAGGAHRCGEDITPVPDQPAAAIFGAGEGNRTLV